MATQIEPNGCLVAIKDDELLVTVHYPIGAPSRPDWRAFVRACHQTAGNLGFGIEFVEKR